MKKFQPLENQEAANSKIHRLTSFLRSCGKVAICFLLFIFISACSTIDVRKVSVKVYPDETQRLMDFVDHFLIQKGYRPRPVGDIPRPQTFYSHEMGGSKYSPQKEYPGIIVENEGAIIIRFIGESVERPYSLQLWREMESSIRNEFKNALIEHSLTVSKRPFMGP